MTSGFRTTFGELSTTPIPEIVGILAVQASARNLPATPESLMAWEGTLRELQRAFDVVQEVVPDANGWTVLLEYEMPRRDKRIDAVILLPHTIVLIEMKVGSFVVSRGDLWQTERYALDLRDFHVESRDRRIAPLLIPTALASKGASLAPSSGGEVLPVVACGGGDLGSHLIALCRTEPTGTTINPDAWNNSAYRATPTIIQAARDIYRTHDVRNISTSGATNLSETVEAVIELVQQCRAERRRGIAFITGAPGSGKTLAGLQVVHDPRVGGADGGVGVFLSGNRPLVEVISQAIAESAETSGSIQARRRRVLDTFIQHAYWFRNTYAEHPEQVPPEHVVLFDEAQRAWDEDRVRSWTKGASERSEPRILLDVMSRVPDWCVVIAMVGGGQEINRGEAGLPEWGRTLIHDHPDWRIAASPAVLAGGPARPGGRLFEVGVPREVSRDDRLDLKMNVRSPRAELLNLWVDAVLDRRIDEAAQLIPDRREFPMVLTRDVDAARDWLRDRAAEDERYGLLASAADRRLMAWGLDTHSLQREAEWANWFLKPKGDVRSSCQLEVPATPFDCQGLELDWTGVCWGSDLTPTEANGGWRTQAFEGNRWMNRRDRRRQFLINGYRVLLTRARRGQVIWVPAAKQGDPSLNADYLDATAALLQRAGVPLLD